MYSETCVVRYTLYIVRLVLLSIYSETCVVKYTLYIVRLVLLSIYSETEGEVITELRETFQLDAACSSNWHNKRDRRYLAWNTNATQKQYKCWHKYTNTETTECHSFLSENKVESGYFQTKGLNFKSKKWRKSKLTFPLNLARPLTDKTRLLLSHLSLTLLPDFASRF